MSPVGHQFTWCWKGHTDDLLTHRWFSRRTDESPFQETAIRYKANVVLVPLIVLWTLQGAEYNRFGLGRGIYQRDAGEWQLLGQALTAGSDSIGLPHSTSLRKQEKFQLLHDIINALVTFVLKPWL